MKCPTCGYAMVDGYCAHCRKSVKKGAKLAGSGAVRAKTGPTPVKVRKGKR